MGGEKAPEKTFTRGGGGFDGSVSGDSGKIKFSDRMQSRGFRAVTEKMKALAATWDCIERDGSTFMLDPENRSNSLRTCPHDVNHSPA
jgi:hypothetical protein